MTCATPHDRCLRCGMRTSRPSTRCRWRGTRAPPRRPRPHRRVALSRRRPAAPRLAARSRTVAAARRRRSLRRAGRRCRGTTVSLHFSSSLPRAPVLTCLTGPLIGPPHCRQDSSTSLLVPHRHLLSTTQEPLGGPQRAHGLPREVRLSTRATLCVTPHPTLCYVRTESLRPIPLSTYLVGRRVMYGIASTTRMNASKRQCGLTAPHWPEVRGGCCVQVRHGGVLSAVAPGWRLLQAGVSENIDSDNCPNALQNSTLHDRSPETAQRSAPGIQ